MSKAPRKLTLNRETLVSLQNNELDQVNGGTSPATPTISIVSRGAYIASVRFCSQVSAITLQQAERSFTGVQKSIETAKKVSGWVRNSFH